MESGRLQENRAESMVGEAVRARATGALFFVGFGSVWMFVGLKQTHHASRTALLLLGTATVLLLGLTALLMRRAHDLPAARTSPEEEMRIQRLFNAINIIQWVSVATAIVILNVLQLTEYIVPAISVIVGLHLFPLAGAFHYRQHYGTGLLLIAWPLACLLALPQGRISGVCALGVATILLLSATLTVLRSFAALRGAVPAAIAA